MNRHHSCHLTGVRSILSFRFDSHGLNFDSMIAGRRRFKLFRRMIGDSVPSSLSPLDRCPVDSFVSFQVQVRQSHFDDRRFELFRRMIGEPSSLHSTGVQSILSFRFDSFNSMIDRLFILVW
jgi:hypothetical protein